MGFEVSVEVVTPRRLAAVRRKVPGRAVVSEWRPALDQVWAFLRSEPGLRTDGHNVLLYHHPDRPGAPMNVDFGVEVSRSFIPCGEVYETSTPSGEAAMAVHRGGYGQLQVAHQAIHHWASVRGRAFAGASWEIYGDWSDDPAKLETIVLYLLA